MIAQMKKLILAGRQSDRRKVLACLRDGGAVHIEPIDTENRLKNPNLEKRIFRVFNAIERLDHIRPSGDGPPPSGDPENLIGDFQRVSEKSAELENTMVKLRLEQQRVLPWGRISSGDIEALRYNGLKVGFFTCPISSIETIHAEIRQVISNVDGQAYVVAVSRDRIFTGSGAIEIQQPDRDAEELEIELKKLNAENEEVNACYSRLVMRLPEIKEHHLNLLEKKKQGEVESCLLEADPIFILKGWVPANCTDWTKEALDNGGIPVAVEFFDPTVDDCPPTKLENPWWCKPAECLFGFLGIIPGYRESDISPFFLPFLTIFTAMLVGDAGYGLAALVAIGLF